MTSELSQPNSSSHSTPFINRDEKLLEETEKVIEKRKKAGLEGLGGGLEFVVINTESRNQKNAVAELLRYSGLTFKTAFHDEHLRTCVLTQPDSADFLVTSRKTGDNPFTPYNKSTKIKHLSNTRLETFVFHTPNLKDYVSIQKTLGVAFMTEQIIETDHFLFIQTPPSRFTGNSTGFIEWRGQRGNYTSPHTQPLHWQFDKPHSAYQNHILRLDHAATRLRAQDRDPAILEFMSLTNYNFRFAIYVDHLNSITNVSRLSKNDFALVFTSGVSPYIDDDQSGPTEKFVHNFGARIHHLAFLTEHIEDTFASLQNDGMEFLVDLVGSPREGLKQTFSVASPNTLIVNEYIYRYGDFDGFFTRSNVAILTEATGKQ